MSPLLDDARVLNAKLASWAGASMKTTEDKLGEQLLRNARDMVNVGLFEEENFDRVTPDDADQVEAALVDLQRVCTTLEGFVQDTGGVVPYNESKDAQDALERLDHSAKAVHSRAKHVSGQILRRAWNEACPLRPEQLQAMQADPSVREDAIWLLEARAALMGVVDAPKPPSAMALRRELGKFEEVRERSSQLEGREIPEVVQNFIQKASSTAGAGVSDLTAEVVEWLNQSGAADRVRVRMER